MRFAVVARLLKTEPPIYQNVICPRVNHNHCGRTGLARHRAGFRIFSKIDFREFELASKTNMPILVVDEQDGWVKNTRHCLAELGYHDVDQSRDMDSTIAMIGQKSYALVIADWGSEPSTGMDVLRAIRALPNGADIRFIMATAELNADHLMAARRAGADNYVIKPFNAIVLRTKINQVLGR